MTQVYIERDDTRPARCDNCNWAGLVGETRNDISDYQERVEAGQETPVGECPECTCLCYYADNSTKTQLEIDLAEIYNRIKVEGFQLCIRGSFIESAFNSDADESPDAVINDKNDLFIEPVK